MTRNDITVIQDVLKAVKPYVYVVGSYATGKTHESSDIDLYVKRRSEDELEADGYYDGTGEESYIDKVIEVFNAHDVRWESEFVGYINSVNLSTMIEVSDMFMVCENDDLNVFDVDVFGVSMNGTIDDFNGN